MIIVVAVRKGMSTSPDTSVLDFLNMYQIIGDINTGDSRFSESQNAEFSWLDEYFLHADSEITKQKLSE